MFPDYLSVSCDYGQAELSTWQMLEQLYDVMASEQIQYFLQFVEFYLLKSLILNNKRRHVLVNIGK